MQQQANTAIALDDLRPIDDLVAQYPRLLTPTTLRWQLRHRETNGLASAVVQLGKKLLVSQSRYEEWLATRTGPAIRAHGNREKVAA